MKQLLIHILNQEEILFPHGQVQQLKVLVVQQKKMLDGVNFMGQILF